MPDSRYPTLEEFWKRLDVRDVEPDLQQALRDRTSREENEVRQAGAAGTVEAVAARILPGAVPARALAVFLDGAYALPLGRGDEREGTMARPDLIPRGFVVLDQTARARHEQTFGELDGDQQDALLAEAEQGGLDGGEGFDSGTWFKRMRDLLLLGYGSDPRGMVQMGYPGPSYQPGHVWLDIEEVAGRQRRAPGYLKL